MSWSINVPKGFASSMPGLPGQEFAEAVRAATIEDSFNSPELLAQWDAQLAAAKKAALEVYSELARRDGSSLVDDTRYSATMSGHANHDGVGDAAHYTTSEFIQVTVNRQPERPRP